MQNRAWILVPRGAGALVSAFRKPRAGLLGRRSLGFGPRPTANCHSCHPGLWLPHLHNEWQPHPTRGADRNLL